jgi:hypothetical protein
LRRFGGGAGAIGVAPALGATINMLAALVVQVSAVSITGASVLGTYAGGGGGAANA